MKSDYKLDYIEYKAQVKLGVRKKLGILRRLDTSPVRFAWERDLPVAECVDLVIEETLGWKN